MDDTPQLIQRAKASDREAFAELYRRTVTPVYRYLWARTGSRDVAEDLTQEVFFGALSTIGRLHASDEAGLQAWLFQIARNKLADHLRRRYRRPEAPLEAAGLISDPAFGPEASAEELEEQGRLRAALERLTPEQRDVVLCKYVLGHDNERTGKLVGKNANAVNQLHHRALGALHRLLGRREV